MQISENFMALLEDASVTDIFCNSASETFVGRRQLIVPGPLIFDNENQLVEFAKQAVDLAGNHLDFANPICDVVLTDHQLPYLQKIEIERVRIHAALSLGISDRNLVSIRLHRTRNPRLSDFEPGAQLRQIASENSFVIAGPAGAGKTTLLRAMLAENKSNRTVIIEDSPELMPITGHFISLTSRQPNSEGRGEITMQRLLTESLRMKPDRIVIGEIRSKEIASLLEALNLGVKQVAFTLHANSIQQVRQRLLTLWLKSGLLASDFDQLIELNRLKIIYLGLDSEISIAEIS